MFNQLILKSIKKLTVVFAVVVSGFVNGQTTEEIDQYFNGYITTFW